MAVAFAILGIGVLWATRQLPPGIGSLPGPGFFPAVLAVLILLFAGVLAFERNSQATEEAATTAASWNWRLPVLTAASLLAYVVVWEWIDFLVRTPLLILILMRSSGATWRNTLLAAVLFPASLYVIFQLGLRVELG